MKIAAKIIIIKEKTKIKIAILIIFCDTNLKLLPILYDKKPIVVPIEFIIISVVSKLPRYV